MQCGLVHSMPPFTHTFLQVSQVTVIESGMAACKMAPVFGCASGFIPVFVYVTCCASVFATDLSGVISLRIYDRHALLAIKSAMDNFQSQRNEVVFHLSMAQHPVYLHSCQSASCCFRGLIGGSGRRESVFLCCFVGFGEKWIFLSFITGLLPVRYA